MPTYRNKTETQVTVDNHLFRRDESKEVDRYLDDKDDVLELLADTPYDNPIDFDGEFSGAIDDTSVFSVAFGITTILLEASGSAEFYRNDLDNTPPLLLTSTRIYSIDNNNEIVTGVIKFLESCSVKVTMLKRD